MEEYGLKVTVQMGTQPEDNYFEGDIIVTTIDQLLSTYIGLSYGSSRNSSNIGPGSLLGAYIVVDEFHLLEIDKSLATIIDLTSRLTSISKLLMMTATAPESFVLEVSGKIGGVYEIVSPKEIVSLQQNENSIRKRMIKWSNDLISPETIISHHKNRTLVVLNTVYRVQTLYKDLKLLIEKQNLKIKIICLHAQFLPNDRKVKESRIKEIFQKESKEEMIVIANQVVEVGLDISCTVLITELCPANSLVQRIGRCTRFGEEVGFVYVHDTNQKYLPYKREIVERTKNYLVEHQFLEMDAIVEFQMVENVHQDDDQKYLSQIQLLKVRDEVNASISSGKTSYIKQLIRDIRNIQIIIHPNPSELDLTRKPERFSVPINKLLSVLTKFSKEDSLSKLAFYPDFPKEWVKEQQPTWVPLSNPEDCHQHMLISLSPRIASYSDETGLILGEQGNYVSKENNSVMSESNMFSFEKETYMEHILSVRKLIREGDELYRNATKRLSSLIGTSPIDLHELCESIGALHDIGKLTKKHVHIVNRWQIEICNDTPNEYLAHTDFDPSNPIHRIKQKDYQRPPHAPAGAYICSSLLKYLIENQTENNELQDNIFRAMFFTIMKHHGAYVQNIEPYQLVKDAIEVVKDSLQGLNVEEFTLEMELDEVDANDININERLDVENDVQLLFYWYFSRRLRLADQLSQKLKSK